MVCEETQNVILGRLIRAAECPGARQVLTRQVLTYRKSRTLSTA
jgi:hypothetical protein